MATGMSNDLVEALMREFKCISTDIKKDPLKYALKDISDVYQMRYEASNYGWSWNDEPLPATPQTNELGEIAP